MAIEVGNKTITENSNEDYVNFDKLDHKIQKTTQFVLRELKDKLEKGLSFDEASKMVEEDFELTKIKWWKKEDSAFWQFMKDEKWRKKLGLIEQGFSTKVENGERIRIPHYSMSADLDIFEEFVINILKEGLEAGKGASK